MRFSRIRGYGKQSSQGWCGTERWVVIAPPRAHPIFRWRAELDVEMNATLINFPDDSLKPEAHEKA